MKSRLLKLIEDGEDHLDFSLVCGIAGDRELTEEEGSYIEGLIGKMGDNFYSELLFHISHEIFEPKESKTLWSEIIAHKFYMSESLNRNVGLSVATMDYLTNIHRSVDSPKMISQRGMNTIAEVVLRDQLTGLYEKFTFLHKLHKEVRRCERYNGCCSLLVLDLDYFKVFNDTYGHIQGDIILGRLGELLKELIRETDIAGRYGGEEFVILFPFTCLEEALEVAERIREKIEFSFKGDTPSSVPLTASIGVSSFPIDVEKGTDHPDIHLLEKADQAVYKAKALGRNKVVHH